MKNMNKKNNMHTNIKKFYDLDGVDYGYRRWKMNPSARFDYDSTKRNILNYLRKNHFNSVLEVGCGPGTWTGILSKFTDHVTAVDISETMITEAKKVIKNPNVIFLNTDVVNFETDKKFDLIFSIRAFEYFDNKELFLKKCRKMLNANGTLFIITKTKKSYWYGKGKIRKILKYIAPFLFYYERNILDRVGSKNRPGFYQERMSVNNLVVLLKKVGFNNFSISPVIIRPPIFMRGKTEIPIIPPFLERPVLAFFKLIDKTFYDNPSFTIFAESYLIFCKKK